MFRTLCVGYRRNNNCYFNSAYTPMFVNAHLYSLGISHYVYVVRVFVHHMGVVFLRYMQWGSCMSVCPHIRFCMSLLTWIQYSVRLQNVNTLVLLKFIKATKAKKFTF